MPSKIVVAKYGNSEICVLNNWINCRRVYRKLDFGIPIWMRRHDYAFKAIARLKELSGLSLFVNNMQIKKADGFVDLNKNQPWIAEPVTLDGSDRLIEVFVNAVFPVKIKICVDGKRIGGDDF